MEAPQSLFSKHLPLYVRIFQTLQYNQADIRAATQRTLTSRGANSVQIHQQLDNLKHLNTEALKQNSPWDENKDTWYALGGQAPYHDHAGNVFALPSTQVPGPDKTVWYCSSTNDEPIVSAHRPDSGCKQLAPGSQ
jgi:hypothetical protein